MDIRILAIPTIIIITTVFPATPTGLLITAKHCCRHWNENVIANFA
jgi:hypothetical protein